MRSSVNRIWTLTKRNTKEILRDPLSLIFTIAMPLFMEILFYLIFHTQTSQFEMKYLAPGIVVFSQAFFTLFIGLLIATDRSTSFLTRLYVSKARSYEFIFSYGLSLLPVVLASSVLFFIVGGIFDTNLFCVGAVYAILLSLITSTFYLACGILFGSLCNEKSIGGISSIVIAGQSVLSGMWFPVEGLNKGMVTFMKVLPFKNATMVIQNVVLGITDPFKDLILPLIIVLAYTVVLLAAAILVYKSKMSSK